MPVVSMSTRALMGIVHAFDVPGIFSAWFISSTNCSVEMWSGVNLRKMPFAHLGAQEEYQVSTLRHSVSGLRTITVSIMENGAGSVDVSARPSDRKMPFAHLGAQEEYQVSTLRHSVSGLRTITVSIMENGAGSVDVSARP